MGWFHDTFGFSSQPAVEAISNVGEKIWDYTAGPDNPVSAGLDSLGFHKAAGLTSLPSWDDLATPGEAFYNEFNDGAGLLPPSWRQYAAPVAATALNFVPGVGPLLSAGFSTAYNAGGMQANDKGMDWGSVGKDALKNFGTAAIQMGANKLVSGANAAQGSKAATNLSNSGMAPATSSVLSAGVPQTASSVGLGTGTGLIPSPTSALTSFNPNSLTSMSSIPRANAIQSSGGLGDKAYVGGVKAGAGMANQAITAAMTPTATQPISGMTPSIDNPNTAATGSGSSYNFGDELSAFGDPTIMGKPNPTGKRIDANALDAMTGRVGSNYLLQESGLSDRFKLAGQIETSSNTPYANQMTDLGASTNKAYKDLLKEVDNYNAYYGIMDANPTLTNEQMNQLIANPELQPENFKPYFQGIQPMSMFNTSMIR